MTPMPTYTRFEDIPQLLHANYECTVPWTHLEMMLNEYHKDYECDMDPDFQRGHVWTEAQQIAYVEWILRGGRSGRDILWNCPRWNTSRRAGQMILVDGKQRIHAVLRFLHNEIPAFETLFNDYKDRLTMTMASFTFCVADLPTRAQVLQWYLQFNAGGTAHTPEEIERVKALLEAEQSNSTQQSNPKP